MQSILCWIVTCFDKSFRLNHKLIVQENQSPEDFVVWPFHFLDDIFTRQFTFALEYCLSHAYISADRQEWNLKINNGIWLMAVVQNDVGIIKYLKINRMKPADFWVEKVRNFEHSRSTHLSRRPTICKRGHDALKQSLDGRVLPMPVASSVRFALRRAILFL